MGAVDTRRSGSAEVRRGRSKDERNTASTMGAGTSEIRRGSKERRASNSRRRSNRRHSSKASSSIHRTIVYDNGSKFKRRSSGRIHPAPGQCRCKPGQKHRKKCKEASRSNSTTGSRDSSRISSHNTSRSNSPANARVPADPSITHQSIHNNFKNNIDKVLRKAASRLSNYSEEVILATESFQSRDSAPPGRGLQKRHPSSAGILILMKNSDVLSRTSLDSNEDRILAHLTGNYEGPDRMGFAAEIVREVRDLSQLSSDSVIDFLLSKEYQGWIKEKQREWEAMRELKASLASNAHARSSNSNVFTSTLKEKTSNHPEPKVVSLIEIFQDATPSGQVGGTVQNHYNYEININTTVQKKRMLGGFWKSSSCCTIL